MRIAGIGRRDATAFAFLALTAGLLFVPVFAAGRTFYWGDLTFIHYPWRLLTAELTQRGVLPLWNPYNYLGMPLAGELQCAAWYPGAVLFYLFPFRAALTLHHAAHFALAGVLAYLWLRRLGASRPACLGGAAAYMLGGSFVSHIPFVNHVSTIALFPGLLLLGGRRTLLAVALAVAFYSGYPPMFAGQIAAAWLINAACEWFRGRDARERLRALGHSAVRWAAAGALGMGLGASLLLPAAQLMKESRRSGGIETRESLTWSFSPSDLVQFTAPPLIGEAYSAPVHWWKTVYSGALVLLAAALGLASLPAAAAAGASA